eukprot:Transcript_6062.p2 GENE.Transcript_6062~~Transcript_6062.p2  ORF type:complete len:203 (-),score=65.77 Transcript_6062:82-690(-)
MAAVAKAVFCFGGHSMLPAQYALMSEPQEAPYMLKVVFLTMGAINGAIGALGYALYGASVLPKFVDNFPPSALTVFIRGAMAYNLQSTVPLVVSAIAVSVLPASAPVTAKAWAYAAAVKGCLLALITAAAISLGDGFDLVTKVGGASVVTAVALLLPISANLKLFRHSFGPLELLCNLLLLAFALAFAAWGTYDGLAEVGLV